MHVELTEVGCHRYRMCVFGTQESSETDLTHLALSHNELKETDATVHFALLIEFYALFVEDSCGL